MSVEALKAALEAMPDLHPGRAHKSSGDGGERPWHAQGETDRDKILARVRPDSRAEIDVEGTDRSRHSASVMFKLFRAGLTDAEVLIIGTGAHFAANSMNAATSKQRSSVCGSAGKTKERTGQAV